MDYRTEYLWDLRNKVSHCGNSGAVYNAVITTSITDEDDAPFTIEQVREWCLIDNSDFDNVLNLLIPAAKKMLEKKLDKSLVVQTITAKVLNNLGGLELPYGPVIEIESITDSEENDVDVSEYNFSTPSISGYLTIVYQAGYEDELPADYKVLWLNKILELFDKRSNVS